MSRGLAKVMQVRPGEPVTVQGVLATYLDQDRTQRLLVYPWNKEVYLNPDGGGALVDASRLLLT
jgi:hypothetical protein